MISSVTLTRNDQGIITRCLKHLDWCDENIVIDDGSSDDTVKLAEDAGAVVYKRPLNGDFSAQRNYGIGKASGDWILFVDSDEVVSEVLALEIQKTIGNTKLSGFSVKRTDTVFGKTLKHGETGNIRLLRLARKGSGMFVRPVHEVWHIQGATGDLREHLLHFPHPSVREFLAEVNTYSSLNAAHFASEKKTVSWWHIPVYPAGKFLVNYIFRLGFLDGMPGLLAAVFMSLHSFLTRGKLYFLNHRHE